MTITLIVRYTATQASPFNDLQMSISITESPIYGDSEMCTPYW